MLDVFASLWHDASRAFGQRRVCDRLRDLSIGLLGCSGRHTVTGMISAAGGAARDWTANYRAFDRRRWDPCSAFDVAIDQLRDLSPVQDVVTTALDDTKLKKTGRTIPGVTYQRDPMSPPFHVNFIRAQRFIQLSWTVPFSASSATAARAFPVDFRHAPPATRPRHGSSDQEQAAYRKAAREQNLSRIGVQVLSDFRARLDQRGASDRWHITSVDGSYTNGTVLKQLPPRTTLIGRIRKDAVLYLPPSEQPPVGRHRWYGEQAPTPEQLLKDESVPWQKVTVFAAGRTHELNIKTLSPLLWRKAGADRPVRLIVIRPLGYRRSKEDRVLYRQPAFLICTDPQLPLERILQTYCWRWDIEVNHRDEKQLIGVGQAQVRAPQSVDRAPAFAVLSYTFLLIAAARCYGLSASRDLLPLPKWRRTSTPAIPNQPSPRLSTGQILSAFRDTLTPPSGPTPNFSHFASRVARHAKCPKSQITQARALAYATR